MRYNVDYTNGSKLLVDEIGSELSKKNITQRDRLLLRGMKYLLEEVPRTRGAVGSLEDDAKLLKKNSILIQAKNHPKTAFLSIAGLLVINSMVNWAGIRKPILQAIILQVFGVLLPLDSIP